MTTEHDVLALAHERIRPAEIARTLNIPPQTVSYYLHRARKRGDDIPKFMKGSMKGSHVFVPRRCIVALRSASKRRDLTPEQLAEKLLVTVATTGLIDAVLDDGAAHG